MLRDRVGYSPRYTGMHAAEPIVGRWPEGKSASLLGKAPPPHGDLHMPMDTPGAEISSGSARLGIVVRPKEVVENLADSIDEL